MISDEQVEKALFFIRDSAPEAGRLAGSVHEAESRRKTQMAMAYLEASGTVAERDAVARTHPAVMEAYADYCECVAEYETIKLQIRASEMCIEIWRTENSNRRAGIV